MIVKTSETWAAIIERSGKRLAELRDELEGGSFRHNETEDAVRRALISEWLDIQKMGEQDGNRA